MRPRYEICIPRILGHEGGYVDDARDPGGATNRGITIATFRRFVKSNGTKEDLKRLTEAQAIAVYKPQYWDTVKADDLPIGVDHVVFDFSVNSGPGRAAKSLQAVIGVSQDGQIGPLTIAAAHKYPATDLINKICDNRLAYMKRIRHRKTKALLWKTYGNGWKTRVERVRANALGDASAPISAPNPSGPPQIAENPRVSGKATGVGLAIAAVVAAAVSQACKLPFVAALFSNCGG